MKTSAIKRIMGLKNKDFDVLQCLKSGQGYKVSQIARLIKQPRTTVGFSLNQLKRRGLVAKVRINNHYEWQKMATNNLESKFLKSWMWLAPDLLSNRTLLDHQIKIEFYRGIDSIKEIYKKILNISQNERVYTIQGLKSAACAHAKISPDYYFEFHQQFKNKRVILECVSGFGVLKLFEQLSQKELRSHYGRLVIAYLVPDELVEHDFDVAIFEDNVMIINVNEAIAILVKNSSIANLFKTIFSNLQDRAKKIDLNGYIKTLINE